jgi:hypothetical protein
MNEAVDREYLRAILTSLGETDKCTAAVTASWNVLDNSAGSEPSWFTGV